MEQQSPLSQFFFCLLLPDPVFYFRFCNPLNLVIWDYILLNSLERIRNNVESIGLYSQSSPACTLSCVLPFPPVMFVVLFLYRPICFTYFCLLFPYWIQQHAHFSVSHIYWHWGNWYTRQLVVVALVSLSGFAAAAALRWSLSEIDQASSIISQFSYMTVIFSDTIVWLDSSRYLFSISSTSFTSSSRTFAELTTNPSITCQYSVKSSIAFISFLLFKKINLILCLNSETNYWHVFFF